MRAFSPAAARVRPGRRVRADPAARAFHDALAAGPGPLAALMGAARPWWKPIADAEGAHGPGWRALFESSRLPRLGPPARHPRARTRPG